MAISRISSTSNLPTGAVSRVASGFATHGYAAIPGTYAPGKYLVVSNCASSANFTTGENVKGYQNAAFKNGDTYVVNVPTSTNLIEFQSLLDQSVMNFASGNYTSAGGQTKYNASSKAIPFSVMTGSPTTSAMAFGYKGNMYCITSVGVLSKISGQAFTSIGTITGLTGWGSTDFRYPVATDGTRIVGVYVNTAGSETIFYTDNPDVITGWSSVNISTQMVSGGLQELAYGNGTFLALAGGSTPAATSINGGVTWTARTMPTSNIGVPGGSVAYGNGTWVYTGQSTSYVYTSSDAITWTARTVSRPYGGEATGQYYVSFVNGRFVLIPRVVTATTNLSFYTTQWSVDGINWNKGLSISGDAASTTVDFAVGNIGSILIANASTSTAITLSATQDGLNWFAATPDSIAGRMFKGTRGRGYSPTSSVYVTHAYQPNASFDIYLLNNNYTTYSSF